MLLLVLVVGLLDLNFLECVHVCSVACGAFLVVYFVGWPVNFGFQNAVEFVSVKSITFGWGIIVNASCDRRVTCRGELQQ